MMDKTYIQEHNILERFVLDDLNASEQKQLEDALLRYPELKSHLHTLEENFETLAFENAIQPPVNIKQRLFENISNSKTNIIPLKPKTNYRNLLGVAASLAGLMLIASIYTFSQWNATQEQLKLVETQNDELNNKLDQISKDYEDTNTMYALINNPNTEKYILQGNNLMPNAQLISYINDVEKSVIINTSYLPELDDKHDYQMWADVDGEMIDMGVIDLNKSMLAMNYIDNSESLNITIEPLGGSDHPTVAKLITNIYIK